MNPKVRFVFKSVTGQVAVITSRLGEESARSAAMEYLWGPPRDWCRNEGRGLDLVDRRELAN